MPRSVAKAICKQTLGILEKVEEGAPGKSECTPPGEIDVAEKRGMCMFEYCEKLCQLRASESAPGATKLLALASCHKFAWAGVKNAGGNNPHFSPPKQTPA